MSKSHAERPPHPTEAASPVEAGTVVPPLSRTVRRHLGQNLRGHYADSLSAPTSERLEALIAQLDKPGR
jgi:hypothetical protein